MLALGNGLYIEPCVHGSILLRHGLLAPERDGVLGGRVWYEAPICNTVSVASRVNGMHGGE